MNTYDKLLFYVLHNAARKKIVTKNIGTEIVEFAVGVVGTERLTAIEQYIAGFKTMRLWNMLSDADDLSFVIEGILVKLDRSIEGGLDGSADGYEMLK